MSGNYVSNCKCENNACPTIYVQGSAKVNIRGGNFSAKQNKSDFSKPQNTCLNLNDEATGMITVYGGSFENFNPADNVAEGAGTNFVASGCKVTSSVIEGITIWTVN